MSRWWWIIDFTFLLFFLVSVLSLLNIEPPEILEKFDKLSSVGGLLVSLFSLALSGAAFRYGVAREQRLTTIGLVADKLASVVRRQWNGEAEVRPLYDPHALPVSWKAAPADLFDSWKELERTARTWPGARSPT